MHMEVKKEKKSVKIKHNISRSYSVFLKNALIIFIICLPHVID